MTVRSVTDWMKDATAISASSRLIKQFAVNTVDTVTALMAAETKARAALEARVAKLEQAAAPAPSPTPTPTPPPSLTLPRQGFSAPLGNLVAHGDYVLDRAAELASGKPSFLRTDWWPGDTSFPTVRAKAETRGLTVMGIYNQDYASRSDQATFAANCAALAKTLTWVNVFNEPDASGWQPNIAGQYAGAAYTAIKAANPAAQVVGPSLSMNLGVQTELDWLDAFFRAGGKVDWLSIHLYGIPSDTWAPNPWKRFSDFQALAEHYIGPGGGLRIIATEAGDLIPQHDEAWQARAVGEGMDARKTLGLASYLDYSIMNDASPGGFGLLRDDLSHRPSYDAFKTRAI